MILNSTGQRRSLADERIETRFGCLVCFIFDVRDEVSLMSELKLLLSQFCNLGLGSETKSR